MVVALPNVELVNVRGQGYAECVTAEMGDSTWKGLVSGCLQPHSIDNIFLWLSGYLSHFLLSCSRFLGCAVCFILVSLRWSFDV